MSKRIGWVVPYTGPEIPCDFCGPDSAKRAIFYHRRRRKRLCAKCMVGMLERHAKDSPRKEP